jgi:hypothetical protein
MTRKFKCKVEELPVIAGFVLSNLKKDMDEFNAYSTMFTPNLVIAIESKINACEKLISSSTVTKELKMVTIQLSDKSKGLRVKLNVVEGYIKLAGNDLDVTLEDVGLRSVRVAISSNNTEGLILNMRKFIDVVKRNMNALVAKGLRPEVIADFETQIDEISVLNTKQNDLISERNRMTKQNIETFNDLWDSLQPVFNAAKAMYRGVDDTKLKDYTVTQLISRVNAKR